MIRHIAGWLNVEAADELLRRTRDEIPWEQRNVRVFGRSVPQPRLVALYGANYGYSGDRMVARSKLGWMYLLMAAVERAVGAEFNSILLNRYRDGRDSIAWHRDDEPELGERPTVASLSLGATRKFSIRDRATKVRSDVLLAHGDLLVMPAGFQDTHEHSMAKVAKAEERISLTFRRIVG